MSVVPPVLAPKRPVHVQASAPPGAPVTPSLPGVSEERLSDAYAACRGITRARARNFYYGLRLTPEPRRSAIFSIYAWMRAADDEADADGPVDERRQRLAACRDLTARVLGDAPEGEGGAGATGGAGTIAWSDLPAFWLAFAATARSYPIERSLFDEMLDGLDEDLDHGGYETDADLSRYCYRVASTVGLACIAVWGLRAGADAGRARELAVRRGQAFQRTNILRDFAQDFDGEPRRVYLPREAFARWGVTAEDLREWRHPERCRGLIAEQAAIARAEYDASAPLVGMIDEECAPTLWAMTKIYSDLLGVIEREPARVVAPRRIRLPATRKALIALTATMRSRRAGW